MTLQARSQHGGRQRGLWHTPTNDMCSLTPSLLQKHIITNHMGYIFTNQIFTKQILVAGLALYTGLAVYTNPKPGNYMYM